MAAKSVFNCDTIVTGGFSFAVTALMEKEPLLATSRDTPPATTRTDTAFSLCEPLRQDAHKGPKEYPCAADARICQVQTVSLGASSVTGAVKAWAVGAPKTFSAASDGQSLSILFDGQTWGGVALESNITLICAETTSDPVIGPSSTESLLQISWKSEAACGTRNPTKGKGSGSMSGTGLFTLFIFLGLFFYVTIGSAFNILVKRINRFPDFLPNWYFWEALFLRATQRNRYERI
ncbi:autophagy-related protein 27 [Chytriomyces cf. hyalinus JEL632]|nr:autophagy-related protein 27 [Chytriomyces cf. hyalinus JEL632]